MPDPVPAYRPVDHTADLSALASEIVESARVLAEIEESPTAEVWASGAVAEWYQNGGVRLAEAIAETGTDGTDIEAQAATALIGWIESGVLPTESGGHPWIAAVGSARVVRASTLVDPAERSERVLVLTFEDSAGSAHDLSVTVAGGRLVDVAAGPPGLIADLLEVPDDPGGPEPRFVAAEVDVESARAELAPLVETCDPRQISARARLDLPVLCRRLGIDPAALGPWLPDPAPVAATPRDRDDDRYAADLIVSALRLDLDAEPPAEVSDAIERFEARVAAELPDARAVLAVAGLAPGSGLTFLLSAVGAYLAPVDLSVHPADEHEPISALEPADWVGVILGLVRITAANPLDGGECVDFINRCPEIATTVPARDAPMVAWAFDLVLYGWEVTGVLDEHGLLTPAGRWLLPRAAHRVWAGEVPG